jgi:hypothetical protein
VRRLTRLIANLEAASAGDASALVHADDDEEGGFGFWWEGGSDQGGWWVGLWRRVG